MNSYDKNAEWADEYHENTNGTQGEDAAYNDKYLSPNGGHIEVIICSPPNSEPYIVDETVDALNMGTYNLASNEIPVVYHIDHFFRDMVPYYLYGNTSGDDVGWLKWVIDRGRCFILKTHFRICLILWGLWGIGLILTGTSLLFFQHQNDVFFWNIVLPFNNIILLLSLIPIEPIACIRAIYFNRDIHQVRKNVILAILSFIFWILYIYAYVEWTGGV
jgi:hypothetical protein